jgi:hypothetical protein
MVKDGSELQTNLEFGFVWKYAQSKYPLVRIAASKARMARAGLSPRLALAKPINANDNLYQPHSIDRESDNRYPEHCLNGR